MGEQYQTIRTEVQGRVGWITLNRPEALNALNHTLMTEVVAAAEAFDTDDAIGVIVVTGSERAFAAGADITEMVDKSGHEMRAENHFGAWSRFADLRKPVVAAVAGFALGGGCELAMMADVIIAADDAQFGQPEITLGIIPGMGGTQRLARAVGPAVAAELILTGRRFGAEEAKRIGLVSKVVPASRLLELAQETAELIAARSLPATIAAKQALRAAQETSLAEGLRYETALFTSLFDNADQQEGMTAFIEKRKPAFRHR